LKAADVTVKEFLQQKAGQSLASLAASEPINSSFAVIPRTADVFAAPCVQDASPETVAGVPRVLELLHWFWYGPELC
jgi:hypothetical protein